MAGSIIATSIYMSLKAALKAIPMIEVEAYIGRSMLGITWCALGLTIASAILRSIVRRYGNYGYEIY